MGVGNKERHRRVLDSRSGRPAAFAGVLIAGFALSMMTAASAAEPVPIGWLHADSYANEESAPAQFWPGNLFDGREASAWCLEGGPSAARGKSVRVAFKGSVAIDRVVVRTGRSLPAAAFAECNRVTSLVIDDGNYRRTLNLDDKRGPQTVQLSPAVASHAVNIVIEEVAGEADLTCITDVIFFDGQRALNGQSMAAGLRYNPQRTPLQGVWAAGPAGSPERYLSLYLDGTFRYVYRPFDPSEEGFDHSGPYRISEGRLRLQIDGQWRAAAATRVSGRDELGEPYTRLRISEAHEELSGIEGDWIPWRR